MKEIFKKHGLSFASESPTNQQFIIISNDLMSKLEDEVQFSFWEKYDENHTVVRFAASWSTTKEDLKVLDSILNSLTA
jgi:threonine aldolase